MQSTLMQGKKTAIYTNVVLTLIALFLGVIALRPVTHPAPVLAQSDFSFLYVEPRTTLLRKPDGSQQVEGKVVIDMRNGDIWGFPTLSSTPYPVDTFNQVPPGRTAYVSGQVRLLQNDGGRTGQEHEAV